ncbi:hypothetical protein BDM02DRAFT_3080943, partial [Thelephora ganbajun]
RNFTRTRAWKASEDVDTFSARYQHTAMFKELADKPALLAALNDLSQVLKDEGADLTGGRPSKAQLLKLSMNSKFVGCAKRVIVEFRNAGYDVSS